MIKLHKKEKWERVKLKGKDKDENRYAITNRGKFIKYDKKVEKGVELKQGNFKGYATVHIRNNGKQEGFFIHRLVAEKFLDKPDKKVKYVIHLDYDKSNNHVSNLEWATAKRWAKHNQKNPNVIKGRKRQAESKRGKGLVLTADKVKGIKQLLFAKNRTLTHKQIAARFHISEMQVYRIKRGENWGHIIVK